MLDGDARMDLDNKTAVLRGDIDVTKESRLGSTPKKCSFSMPPGIKEEPQELSSIGVSYCAVTSRSCETASRHRAEERAFKEKSCQETHVPVVIDLISDDDDDDYSEVPHGGKMPSVEGTSKQRLPTQITTDSVSKHSGKKLKSPCQDKFKDDQKDVPSKQNTVCKYCKNGEYPKLHVKVEQVVQSNKSVVQKIFLLYMDADDDDDFDFPDDYLKLLDKRPEDFDSGKLPLLPSEALKILMNLSDKVVNQLKMDSTISRPEALVFESILIPPNCNRIPETPVIDELKIGSDKITNCLAKILTKVPVMKRSRVTAASNRIAIDEMQSLIADYLRLKGAPKVRGNKEPSTEYVRTGKPLKHHPKASLNDLHKHFAAKVSSFSCRAVLTGDANLALDEIGIPYSIAEGLTVFEMVTEHNREKMQVLVENISGSKSRVGALFYVRSGSKKDLKSCEMVSLEVGDSVGRLIQDGDYVFCNRPPSVHKHSILGLRVRILNIPSLAINPLICVPLGADFDGDCLAVFVPQSLESKTEVKELMMVENQMLTSHGGQCTFTLTQDALLGACKLTSPHLFLSRQTMEIACMNTSSMLPKPAVIKSPKGPFWTGVQCFQLSLPSAVNYDMNGVRISCGEIMNITHDPEWLGGSRNSLLYQIIQQFGGNVALNYLGAVESLLVEWISRKGFTVGLYDVYATADWTTRDKLKKAIQVNIDEEEKKVRRKLQDLSLQSDISLGEMKLSMGLSVESNAIIPSMYSRMAEKIALKYIQKLCSHIESDSVKNANADNSMLEMVRCGSKGSIKKFSEQFAFLGLQPYKGKFMHPTKNMQLSCMHQDEQNVMYDQDGFLWGERGIVKSSFAEGLSPQEFFVHTVSYRETMIHKALRVSEPGYLYKNMVLFARDVCMHYDGTVRSEHGKRIIQFDYGCKESNMPGSAPPGEPVGFLAATAISQPAYQMLLESPNQLNDLAFCPLELLQETIYSRKASVLKPNDLRVVLYMKEVDSFSKELAAMEVSQSLQHVTLGMLLCSLSVKFVGNMQAGFWKGLLPAKKSPWIVHMLLDQTALSAYNLEAEAIEKKLLNTNSVHSFGELHFVARGSCDLSCPGWTRLSENPCLSFCITTAQSPSIEEALSQIRDLIVPHIMKVSVKGDRRIKSVSILTSGILSEPVPFGSQEHYLEGSSTEIALEVTIHGKLKSTRQKTNAWNAVLDLCGSVLHKINWLRSMPSGIQAIASIYGIEAAHNCIYHRLKSILSMFDKTVYDHHVMLITELMTHSGNVIGLNAAGFREINNSLHISAPITQSLFQSSIKHIQTAALRGKSDDLSGTLAAICWGKLAPVGTGAKFDILWRKVELT
ncbi:hypothetical protein KP509_1Z037800 [Ceratopteris richardii]|nr:hypothetical protein KP509_1Z037800 [Ceratopteris richardii]